MVAPDADASVARARPLPTRKCQIRGPVRAAVVHACKHDWEEKQRRYGRREDVTGLPLMRSRRMLPRGRSSAPNAATRSAPRSLLGAERGYEICADRVTHSGSERVMISALSKLVTANAARSGHDYQNACCCATVAPQSTPIQGGYGPPESG
jgi:hypothetical protein